MTTKNYFRGKKITVHGLGLLGRGIGDVIFLAKEGADLLVTDLKTKEDLAESLKQTKKELGPVLYKKIKFVLGEHKLENFKNRDFILKAAGVPLDSPFVAEARKNDIPIKMDASWFAELAPEGVTIIGVTGTRGKSTVTHLIYEIFKLARLSGSRGRSFGGRSRTVLGNIYLGGNVRGLATLPLLKKIKPGDVIVMELDSWQLQGFGPASSSLRRASDSGISPNVSVFTNLMVDHQNYYGSASLTTSSTGMDLYFADKANIFLYQKEGDHLVCGPEVLKLIRKKYRSHAGRAIVPDIGVVPKNWKIKLLGEHNLLNTAYAITVARILDVPEKIIKQAVEKYTGVPGRLEFVREVGEVKYYNDTTATTPDGVIAALKALAVSKNSPSRVSKGESLETKIVLIGGGRDKELDYKKYAPVVKKFVKSLALFAGSGTDKIIKELKKTKFPVKVFDNMSEAFAWSNAQTQKGDIVLLSPGAASFGVFKNEFDRGDQFNACVKNLKDK